MIPKRCIIPVFVPHLGCPNLCVFCDQRRITGLVKTPDEAYVRETVSSALKILPQDAEKQLAFYGGSFTAIPVREQEKLLGAALPFLRDGDISSLRVSTRPDAIDPEKLDRLQKYGVRTIELGTQSMCDEVLELSGRGHTAEDTVKAAKLIKSRGFELILQMMTGLPGDTKQRSVETAEKIIALAPDGVRIYPAVILKNTPMEDMWRAGTYKEHTVPDAVDYCAAIVPMFEKAGIPVIRLGLNPTEELSGGDAVGGAYHPALGELVRSRIMLERARKLFEREKPEKTAVLGVNPSEVSVMTGQHRCNVETLEREFSLEKLRVSGTENVPKGQVILMQVK